MTVLNSDSSPIDPKLARGLTDLLSPAEHDLVAMVNKTRTEYPRDRSLGDLFAEHVGDRPDASAVTYAGVTLTYRQLDRVTNSLAARLRELGVRRGALVAIHADRDLSAVVGMLGTIKAGGAYLPLEPTHPISRLRAIVEEAMPAVLLTAAGTDTPVGSGVPVIAVAEHLTNEVRDAAVYDARVDGAAGPADLAYVMYTSGSSGRPKGICVTHRNVVRLVRNTDYVTFEPGDRVAQISNAAFDAATFEVWGAWLNGGELVGFDRDTILSPGLLAAALRERGINTMVMATPLFNQLAADDPATFATISQLLVGGDVLAVGQADAVAALPGCALVNGYGPTECTTFATAHRVGSVSAGQLRVPIGRPIANTTCYVLDDLLRLQPTGVPGQLYIGGEGVARGYLGRPGLTAGRFVPDPFALEPGARMYSTGDLVCQLPDGSLDFLGRTDFQVKIRGFRIEMTEIDATLLQHPSIGEALTVVVDSGSGDKSLVSYYVSAGGVAPETDDLVMFLRDRLPAYMIPSQLFRLPELPKNANMKVDRARLPGPVVASSSPGEGGGALGADALDDEVATIIGQLLKVPEFGRGENFFDAGGHSLLATRLLAQLRKRFHVNMTLADLFDDPTARGIAGYVRQHVGSLERRIAAESAVPAETNLVPASRAPEWSP